MNNEYIHVRAAEGAIKNGQSRETGNIGYTRYKKKTNKEKLYTTEYVLDTIIHKIYNDINLTLNYDEIKFMFDVMTRIKTIIYQV
jgi:hypothetical protein